MMKNKNLITEISRIQEIMGVSLLTEQDFTKLASEFVEMLTKNTDEFSSLLSKHQFDLQNLAKAVTDDEAIKILAKLANAEAKFADIIIPKIREAVRLDQALNDELARILTNSQKLLDDGEPIAVVLNKAKNDIDAHVKTEFQGLKDILKKEMADDLVSYKPKPKPPTPQEPEPPAPAPSPQTLEEFIQSIFSFWDELAPGVLTTREKALMNSGWFRGLRYKINYLYNSYLTSKNGPAARIQRIAELLKRQEQLIRQGQPNNNIIWRTINSELEGLRTTDAFDPDVVIDMIEKELGKIQGIGPSRARELTQKIKANPTLGPKVNSWMKDFLGSSYIMNIPKLPRKDDGKVDKLQMVLNLLDRTGMFLTTGNFRKAGEVFEEFFRKNGISGFLYWLGWLKFVKIVLWPPILAFMDFLYYPWKEENPDGTPAKWWQIYGKQVVENFADQFTYAKLEYDAVAKKFVKDRDFDLLQTLNPFEIFWDNLSNAGDWYVAGGAKEIFDNATDEVKKNYIEFQQMSKEQQVKTQQAIDNLEKKFNDNAGILVYTDTPKSFIDYQIASGAYSPEKASEATNKKQLINGVEKTVYTTHDGESYYYENANFIPYTPQ